MRDEEAFVGRALVDFFGGSSVASVTDGGDPPDLCLTIESSTVGVEVTRLMQMTFKPDGKLGNRATDDFTGIQWIDRLNSDADLQIPDSVSVMLTLWMPVENPARVRTQLIAWIKQIAPTSKPGYAEERTIAGARVSVSFIPRQSSSKKVVGAIVNTRSSPDIALNARLALETRVREKSRICAKLNGPIWLALLNDYWLADADTYAAVCRQLSLVHCFERIFLVSTEGDVDELVITA